MIAGLGVDAVDVERFAEMMRRRPRLAERLFTEGERKGAAGQPERLAARFAAKEALMKALGVGLGAFGFHDAEVVKAASGQPILEVAGHAKGLCAERGVATVWLSMTHTHHTAVATVVLETGL